MSNYFIIHGTFENPSESWFPWLTNKLAEEGKNVIIPCFPGESKQNYNNWSKLLKYYYKLGLINEDTIFVCHSIGAAFVSKYLIKNKIKVKSLITVAGFNGLLNTKEDERNKTFIIQSKDLAKVDKYIKNAYCFYSNDDPYVSRDLLETFIHDVKGEKCLINNAGHFDKQSSHIEFLELLEKVKKIDKEAFNKEFL